MGGEGTEENGYWYLIQISVALIIEFHTTYFICRIFHKIKSRSAHMKTHVKRPDDDDSKMAAKLTSSKSH